MYPQIIFSDFLRIKKVRRNTAGKNKYAAGKQAFKARFPASFLNSASSFLSVLVKRYSAFLISAVLCTFRLLSGSAPFHRPYIDSVHLDMIVHRDHQTLPPVNDPRLYKIRPVRVHLDDNVRCLNIELSCLRNIGCQKGRLLSCFLLFFNLKVFLLL